jgi:hypothetical protein
MNTFQEATEKQVAFINSLVEKRVVPAHVLSQLEDEVLSKADASHFIDLLKDLPYKRTTAGNGAASQFIAHPAEARVLGKGFYTVADGEGGHVTFRIRIGTPKFAEGKTIIGVLVGSNNERSYEDFGFVTERGISKWGRSTVSQRVLAAAQFLLTGSLDEARAEFLNQSEANAMTSNTCLCCLKTLTVPASVSRGLGPVCAAQFGL